MARFYVAWRDFVTRMKV